MTPARLILPLGLLALTACTEPGTTSSAPAMSSLPQSVKDLADPNQDLTRAYYNTSDGCYWYRYDGPVEITDLPLRTTGGAPICTRARAEATG